MTRFWWRPNQPATVRSRNCNELGGDVEDIARGSGLKGPQDKGRESPDPAGTSTLPGGS